MPAHTPARLIAAALTVTASTAPIVAAVNSGPVDPVLIRAAGSVWLSTLIGTTILGQVLLRVRPQAKAVKPTPAQAAQALTALAAKHTDTGNPEQQPATDGLDAELAALTAHDATEMVDGPAFSTLLTGDELEHLIRLDLPDSDVPFHVDGDAPPVPRKQTTGSAAAPDVAPRPAKPAPAVGADDLTDAPVPPDVVDRLADAWNSHDVDTLAAIADRVPTLTLAASVLAAAAAAAAGDPASYLHLRTAFDTGADPADDPALAAYRDALRFTIEVPELGLAEVTGATRGGLAAALAAGDRHIGDPDGAYATVLAAPTIPIVRVMRALLEYEAGWYTRAVTSTWDNLDGTHKAAESVLDPVLRTLEGQALLGLGDAAGALRTLDMALRTLDDTGRGRGVLARRARLARAHARRDTGDTDGARADAIAVLDADPANADAEAFLEAL